MKNMVIFVMLLALTPAADAATAGFVAPIVVDPGETVTISLVADAPCEIFMIDAVSDGGKGGTVSNLQLGEGVLEVAEGWIENTAAGVLFSYMCGYAEPAIPSGEVLLSFDYHVPVNPGIMITVAPLPTDTLWYSDIDDAWYLTSESSAGMIVGGVSAPYPIAGVNLFVTPEPMTILLLGLGGLAIRRCSR